MRTLPALVALLALAGCAGTAPVPLPAAPPAEIEPPRLPPVRVVEAPEVVDVGPVEPPAVPERRIDRRSAFDRAGAVDWTLANGLTVVYVHEPGAEGYHARVVAPTGWASLPPERREAFERIGEVRWGALSARVTPGGREATGLGDGLGALVDDVARLLTGPPDGAAYPSARDLFAVSAETTVLLAGPRDRSWVEPVVAGVLGALPARRDAFGAFGGVDSGPSISGAWDDLPAALILDRALADRAGPGARARVSFDADAGRIRLDTDGATPAPVLLAGLTDEELRRARDRAAAEAATPAGRLEAFAALYDLPGRFRPARDPAEAAALPGRIARTPPSAAADLLRRLSAAR